jgi:hypothetical protein
VEKLVLPNMELIGYAIERWNKGDVGALTAMFAEDVAYCSPLAGTENESYWLQGPQEVAEHFLSLRKDFEKIELVEVLAGAGFTNLLLRHAQGSISLLIEPDEQRRARRIIACHTIEVLQQ